MASSYPQRIALHLPWLIYAIVLGLGLAHHEIWMDEAHHWLVPRDSNSLWEMLHSLRYEGHPGLWNVLLYGLSSFGEEVWMMQLVHGMLATGTIYLLVVHTSFPFWVKCLVPFGYFTLFEYGMISRNYALAFLLAFLFVWEYKKATSSLLRMLFILALLANTHLLGFCLSLLLCLYIRWEKGLLANWPASLYLLGLMVASWQIIPPGDHPMVTGLDWAKMTSWPSLKQVLLVFQEAFFPLHDFNRHHFWHTNWLEQQNLALARVISLAIAILPYWFFRKKPQAWLLFYGIAGAVILLSALKGVNYERFHGFIYMSFLLLLWLEEPKIQFSSNKALTVFIGFTLIVQLSGAAHAYYQDWKHPFSESKRAAIFLQAPSNESLPIIGGYCFGESLQAYLPQSLQYPEHPEESFCRWEIFSPTYLEELQSEDYYSRLLRYFLPYQTPSAILVSHQPLDLPEDPILRPHQDQTYLLQFTPLATFTDNIKQMEAFYLYRFHLSPQ